MINVLAQRAASPAHKNDCNDVPPAQMDIDYIMDERERELAGEFTRWYDMARPGAAVSSQSRAEVQPAREARTCSSSTACVRFRSRRSMVYRKGPKYPQNPEY